MSDYPVRDFFCVVTLCQVKLNFTRSYLQMIHVAVCILIFCVSFQILRMSVVTSFTASAIFAVHPVHTEAVSSI